MLPMLAGRAVTMDQPTSIVIVATGDGPYLRRLVSVLCQAGHPPRLVLLGSRAERWLGRVESFIRIRRQIGLWEALRRILRQRRRRHGLDADELAIERLATLHKFDIVEYERVNGGRTLLEILRRPGSLVLLAGAGIVGRSFLRAARCGCINGHPAILPGLRGVDVVDWALFKGRELGVAAHFVAEKVDSGDILKTRAVAVVPGESYGAFLQRIELVQAENLAEAAIDLMTGVASPSPNPIADSELCMVATHSVAMAAEKQYLRLAGGEPVLRPGP